MFTNREKVLNVFFDDPIKQGAIDGFYLKQICEMTNLSPISVKTYLEEFIDAKLILKEVISSKFIFYKANRDDKKFQIAKSLNMIYRIYVSGLSQYLIEQCNPKSIILFGSASRGEDLILSDVDIYVQAEYKILDLKPFEAILKRKINILFEPNFESLSSELKNNLINGVKLDGFLKIGD